MNAAQQKPRATQPASSGSYATLSADASLARYFSDLSAYELLTRDDEIALAKDVEGLEIAYWQALLGWPQAFSALNTQIAAQAPEVAAELRTLARAAVRAGSHNATRIVRSNYERAALRLAAKLRVLDVQRDIVKHAHATAVAFCTPEDQAAARAGKPTKAMRTYLASIEGARRDQQAAKDRFVAANLRLVVSMARRYARSERMPLADLIQEGNLGLMKAVERFDFRRGFRFSTYASWWIRHALTRGMADKGRLVRLPVHALETRARVARATRKAVCRTGVRPSHEELAEATGLALDKVSAAEELSVESHFSLDAPVGADNDRTFVDLLRDDEQRSAEDIVLEGGRKESLTDMMQGLSAFEAQILRYRFGFDGGEERTLKEIGEMYNLSRERIRQIQALALAKMRQRAQTAERESAAV
ncbi:MAG TPA: sigma-70 family RNA polymerase sigma factor [Polyangiales bacterium]